MQRVSSLLHFLFFFALGATAAGAVLSATAYLVFTVLFRDRIYPGVRVGGVDFSRKTAREVEEYFAQRSRGFWDLKIDLSSSLATSSAKGESLGLAFDGELMARRSFSIGRQTKNPYYNFLQILAATQGKVDLPLELRLDEEAVRESLAETALFLEKKPVDAIFQFLAGAGPDGKGRVSAFRPSEEGAAIDYESLIATLKERMKRPVKSGADLTFNIPVKTVLPAVSTSTADELGIKHLLGRGESYFYDSIAGRIYNIGLGTEKINGRLVAPGEIFSFNEAIGTVSAVFGFQKAYTIVKGKTVLEDGGGVCQVSTTLYRAALAAGLPVIERTAHTYRVGFYEQGGFLPGLDATVYPPSPDFRFKNDTGNWLLIQATFDRINMKLSFDIFGTSDGRKTTIAGPYFISTSPPPEPIFEDDPNLPAGQTKQVDTAHPGAKVYFKRTVTRSGETLINETVYSDYIPWPARFLRGTKT